jgi:hypothetical protein
MLSLFPEKGRPSSYSIRSYHEPSPFSSDAYTSIWEEAITGKGDFSGKRIVRGDQITFQKSALETEKKITTPDGEKIKNIFAVGCTYKSSTAEGQDVDQDCERFFESIRFSEK